jgi:hypothetical protein
LIIKEKNGFLLILVIIQKLKNHIILVPRKLLLVEILLFLMKLNFGHEAMMIFNKILQLIQMAIMTKEGKIYGGSTTTNK